MRTILVQILIAGEKSIKEKQKPLYGGPIYKKAVFWLIYL